MDYAETPPKVRTHQEKTELPAELAAGEDEILNQKYRETGREGTVFTRSYSGSNHRVVLLEVYSEPGHRVVWGVSVRLDGMEQALRSTLLRAFGMVSLLLILGLLFSLGMAVSIAGPLKKMVEAVRRVPTGKREQDVPGEGPLELRGLVY